VLKDELLQHKAVYLNAGFFITRFLSRTDKGLLFNLIEGLIRVAILVAYIWGISLLKDVKTLFQYHGAEHKVVNCYEAGIELTITNVKRHSRIHPRCGTSFLINGAGQLADLRNAVTSHILCPHPVD
jgi:uncharacterized protein YqhQ